MNRKLILTLKLSLLTLVLFISNSFIFSQNYKFKTFNTGDRIGLPSNAIYSIIQSKNGYLWLGTGEGLVSFDGNLFSGQNPSDSVAKGNVNSTFKDSQGNLWFGHADGTVTYYDGKIFRAIKTSKEIVTRINSITQDKKGNIYCVSESDGIVRISPQFESRIISKPADAGLLYSIAIGADGEFIVGSATGLYLYQITEDKLVLEQISKISSIPSTKIQCIYKLNELDRYFVGTEDEGLFILDGKGFSATNYQVNKVKLPKDVEDARISSVFKDIQGNLWVSTMGKGLLQMLADKTGKGYTLINHYDETNGLPSNYITGVYQDREGIVWISTYNAGLASISGEFISYDLSDIKPGKSYTALCNGKNFLWLGTENGIVRINQEKQSERSLITLKNGLPHDNITALFENESDLWIGTANSGIYKMNIPSSRASRYFSSPNVPDNSINAITGKKDLIYAASNNGILKFDLKTGTRKQYSMNEGLTYNKIQSIFLDKNDSLWYATKGNGLYILGGSSKILRDKSELEFTCIATDKYGNLWAGTNGNGVVRFQDTSVFVQKNGLKSDYCYSIVAGLDGNIWVGHREGVSRINPETNSILVYGVDNGFKGDLNPNAILFDEKSRILFGTTEGLIAYDYSKEIKLKVAPALVIKSIRINDKPYDINKPIKLPYFGNYKIQIEFIGLYFTSPGLVSYSYKFFNSGDEPEWSTLSKANNPANASYVFETHISDGNFVFKVKSCSGELVCNDTPIELQIYVKPPLWKTWYFILSMVLLLIALVYGLIKYNEHRHVEYEKKLQKELDERTREVMIQKEEIEIKNRDITDSINYAQRIQASILPSMKRLHERFSGSFIFYQPRDIVSGDFYWFDMVGQDKFMIVCADSTGHGVPGAFMSMIGTTLIKDICIRNESFSPADILRMLDTEIRGTLNQNVEAERSNDGMDIIVCEIDIRTYQVRISSAMRPLIVYRSGEQIYIPGSKCSVGGVYEEKEAKIFEENTYTLSKGDLIYMFSDGYPDQFGGPVGKKFKMVRLRNLLQHIYTKPMDEQYQHVMNNFHLWRGNFEQVDDVLFLGIKI